MNVSSFLSGNFLTHVDLPQSSQCWTISKTGQQLVGTDQKIVITFAEFPAKPLGLNKTNLGRIAKLNGFEADAWAGKQLQVYRSRTTYSGKVMPCVRVCSPQQLPPEGVCDANGNPVGPQPAPQTPPYAVLNPVGIGPVEAPPQPAPQPQAVPEQAQQPVAPAPGQQPVALQPVVAPAQPVAVPQPEPPVAAPQPTPWEADQATLQQNSPPSA